MAGSSRAALAALLGGGLFQRQDPKEKTEPLDLSAILNNSMTPSRRSVSFSTDIEREFKSTTGRRAKTRPRERVRKPTNSELGEIIFQRGQQFLQRKHEKSEELFRATYSFKPQLDAYSVKISRNSHRKPLYPEAKLSPPPLPPEEVVEISPRKSEKRLNLEAFLDRNYVKPKQAKSQKRELSLERERAKETEECTFRPNIDSNSKKMIDTLYDRALKLREKKQQIYKETVEARLTKELQECTFAPKLLQSSPNRGKKSILGEEKGDGRAGTEGKGREEDLVLAGEELMVQALPFEAVIQRSPEGS